MSTGDNTSTATFEESGSLVNPSNSLFNTSQISSRLSLEIVTRDINYIKNDIDSLKFNFATLKPGIESNENFILSTIKY